MTKVKAFKDFLIPEGSYVFQIDQPPFSKKIKEIYDGVVFPLLDIKSGKHYQKLFFIGTMKELLDALGIPVDEDGSFDDADAVGKMFKCNVVHDVLKSGNKTETLKNIQISAWDE
jgi:hypothetical protein